MSSPFIDRCIAAGVWWQHDGNPRHPHALLTSGLHSIGFFNRSRLIEHTMLVRNAASVLIHLITDNLNSFLEHNRVTHRRVVGPAEEATTLAHELAGLLSVHHNVEWKMGFTEKNAHGVHELKRFSCEGEHVLVVEDVITTGKTTREVIEAVEKSGGTVLPFCCALLNRSGSCVLGKQGIYSLMEKRFKDWTPEECPLCAQGSNALNPDAHWAELTQQLE